MVTFLQQAAGVPRDGTVNASERVALVSEFLRAVDRGVDNIVWIPLREAMMGVGELQAAQLTFYRGVNLRSAIDRTEYQALPPEVEANPEVFDRSFTGKEDQLCDVLVRVPMSGVPMAHAIQECVRTVEALLSSMGKVTHHGWVIDSPVLHFVDGLLERSTRGHRQAIDWTASKEDWRLSPVYANLSEWSVRMTGVHYKVTPEYDQTLDCVRSYNRLGVRTFAR